MKIVKNTSSFDTRGLRSIFCKTYRVMERYEGPCRAWKGLRVTVRGKAHGTSGHAYVGSGPIVLSLAGNTTTKKVAALFWHEMMHVYGYESHLGGRCDPADRYIDEICSELPFTPPPAKRAGKPTEDVVAKRYARILARERDWKRKLDRADNALRKARREREVYESRHGNRLDPSNKSFADEAAQVYDLAP